MPEILYAKMNCLCSESSYDLEFLHMMRGKEGTKMTSVPKINWLEHGQLERMVRLEKLPAFKGLTETVESSEVGSGRKFIKCLDAKSA